MQRDTSPLHRVDCDLWNVVSLFSDCKVAVYWWELEHAVIHVNPEHPKHAQWMTCLSMQAMEEHFQLP